jgi:hypothetical protein
MVKPAEKQSFKLENVEKPTESVLRARTNLRVGLLDSGGWCAPTCINDKRRCWDASYKPFTLPC